MKFGQLFIGLVFGILLGFGLSKFMTKNETSKKIFKSQTTETNIDTTKWNYDENLDAIKAAPNSHKIVYEDGSVRILQVNLNKHKTEPIHTHKYKSVMWFTQATPMVYYTYNISNKNTIKDSISIPQMPANALNVGGLMEAEGPHAVKNLGDKIGIAYRIEFKKEFK